MDRKEAETSLKNDWYINNGNLIVEHDKVNRFLEACGMGIKALHEPEIIKCKDCISNHSNFCNFIDRPIYDDDYCSYGVKVRKNDRREQAD